MDDVLELVRAGDTFAVVEYIQRNGTPLEIAAQYESLVLDFYWKAHDLPAVVLIGRAGITYCLEQSLAAGMSPETIEKLRQAAKGLAYNIGSFTWPGWEEPGISPSPEEIAFGRECAGLNLRLAIELKRPPKGVSKAHWLIGAHALVTRDFELAEKEFRRAQDVLAGIDKAAKEMEPCNMGYLAVTQMGKDATDLSAKTRFEEIAAQLAMQDDEYSQEYLSQLVRARRLFVSV